MRTLILLFLTTTFLHAQEREFDFSIEIEEFKDVLTEVIELDEAQYFQRAELGNSILLVVKVDPDSRNRPVVSKLIADFINDPFLSANTHVELIDEGELHSSRKFQADFVTKMDIHIRSEEYLMITLMTSNQDKRETYILNTLVSRDNSGSLNLESKNIQTIP